MQKFKTSLIFVEICLPGLVGISICNVNKILIVFSFNENRKFLFNTKKIVPCQC